MSALALQSFGFEGQTVRVLERDAMPWFVAQDVCACLSIANHKDAVARLDDDEKGVGITDTLGGEQQVLIVSESGLYALIFKSRKAEAVRFRKWVTGVVLPTLRRTGSYALMPAANDAVAVRPLENLETQAGREQARILLVAVRETRCIFGNSAAGALWIKLGFPPPDHVALPAGWQPSKKYLFAPDVNVARWRDQRLIEGEPEDSETTGDLYQDFRAWCERRGIRAMDHSTFGKNLNALGVAVHYANGSHRMGVRLDRNSPP